MRVMPSFWAMTPDRMVWVPVSRCRSELDFDVDAGRQVELHQSVDGLGGRIEDVENALVRADLELLTRLLVDVRRAVHRKFLDAGRQGNGTPTLRPGPLRRRDDLAGRCIENPMIERLEANADV